MCTSGVWLVWRASASSLHVSFVVLAPRRAAPAFPLPEKLALDLRLKVVQQMPGVRRCWPSPPFPACVLFWSTSLTSRAYPARRCWNAARPPHRLGVWCAGESSSFPSRLLFQRQRSSLLFACFNCQDCGMIRDYDNPTVRLPESVADGVNLNPTDENVIETVSKSNTNASSLVHGETR